MDWDAERYHRLSDPQREWGQRVLDRLAALPGESILDIGCGTGRLTAELLARAGPGLVVGLDRSAAMLKEATRRHAGVVLGPHELDAAPPRIRYVRGDAAALPFVDAFDAVFSTATFHWVRDHDALFASIARALAPGGRLIAQCGGGPNLAVLLERAHRLMQSPRYARHFVGWSDPWMFADVPTTIGRLRHAGFTAIDVSLEAAPTTLPDAERYADFLSCVCVRHHVDRLPEAERPGFLAALTAEAAGDTPAFTLDYWRLNIAAVKPAGAERAA
ncbi:MAG TPA: methyltransferase domain-containing protein [Vicinamibacterales bacterium]|nr:methyltransferase domain-containing protein [Vicinamibacterales bacterium]